MPSRIYLDGKLVDPADAKVSVFDHGLLYGDGVFEGLRIYNGIVFELDAHIRRLYDSAKAIRLEIPITQQQMTQATIDTVKANGLDTTDGYIRLVVTRGVGALGISPSSTSNPSVIIIADQIELYPPELYEKGLALIISSVLRNHNNALSPRIKSLNYLNNILAKIEALDAGVLEAVMLNTQGNVAECTGDNIFIVRDGKLRTPSLASGNLGGVTRQTVIDLAKELGIEVAEDDITRYDLYSADECFLTGSAAEVIPATSIDGRDIGDGKVGPITKQLTAAFHARVREIKK